MDSDRRKSCPLFHRSRPTRNRLEIATGTGQNCASGSRRRVESPWFRILLGPTVLWLHRKNGLRSGLLRASPGFTLSSGLSLSLSHDRHLFSLSPSRAISLSLSLGSLGSPSLFFSPLISDSHSPFLVGWKKKEE
jgi:hypothetical protein